MRNLRVIPVMVVLTIMSLAVAGYAEPYSAKAPPIATPLVREGDFAVKLADELNLGVAQDEAQAESALASVGIAPRHGWIADYPMTPDILIELQTTAGEAAESGRLTLSREEAVKAVQEVSAEFKLPVFADGSEYGRSGSPEDEYYSPSEIESYYSVEGPPILTYYAPPPDYYYLYNWVPFPFFFSGVRFGGFFILRDFHRVVRVRHADGFHRRSVTNHFVGHRFRGGPRVNPATRRNGGVFVSPNRTPASTSVPVRRSTPPIVGRGFSEGRRTAAIPRGREGRGFLGAPPAGRSPAGLSGMSPGRGFGGPGRSFGASSHRAFRAPSGGGLGRSLSMSGSRGSSFGSFHSGGGFGRGGFAGRGGGGRR